MSSYKLTISLLGVVILVLTGLLLRGALDTREPRPPSSISGASPVEDTSDVGALPSTEGLGSLDAPALGKVAREDAAVPSPPTTPFPLPKDGPIDPAGVTAGQRLEYLMGAHDFMLRTCTGDQANSGQAVLVQKMFLLRCVAAQLYARGRVAFPSETGEEEAKRYHASDAGYVDPNRYVFSADGAWFEFFRGEFPDYDTALDFLTNERLGVLDKTAGPSFASLYEKALATFEASPDKEK